MDIIIIRKFRFPTDGFLHLIVVVGFECSRDLESYAGGSVATGRDTHAKG
jgi:hypothetical protein